MSKATVTAWPVIDERVKAVGTSYLRKMNAGELATLNDSLLLIQDSHDAPLAIMVSYEMWLRIQVELESKNYE